MLVCDGFNKAETLVKEICDCSKISVETGVNASSLNEIKLPEIWLFQFLPKMQKMDLIIRQSTECGVTKIIRQSLLNACFFS